MKTNPLRRVAGLGALLGLLASSSVYAQAWLAPKGEASFSFAYQYVYAGYHTTASGDELDLGKMRWQYLISDLDYAVTDRLTFRAGIPYVISRYSGNYPHAPDTDNGNWNGTFSDFRLEARYMAKAKGLVITPFLGVGLPSHDYETYAHSAA